MTDQRLHFTTNDNKVWARNTFGFEGVAALMSKQAGGMNHLYIGTSVKFATPITASKLAKPAADAWTRLRHWAPIIGTRTVDGEELNVFSITYSPPTSAADAEKWATETVKWDDKEITLDARDDAIKDVWWSPADKHWGAELHVGPCEGGQWSFFISIGHWVGDARGTIPLMDKFFELLVAELDGSAKPPIEQVSWGTETAKLAPVATQALKLSDHATEAAAAQVESNLGSGKGMAPADAPPPPPMLSRPVGLKAGDGSNVKAEPKSFTQRVVLSAEETAALTKASKAHGATVTETVNTILVLSEIETILRTAAKDEDKWAEVKASYDGAAIYPLALTTFNRRDFLAAEYANHDAPKGTPSFAFEGFPIMHNMDNLRKSLSIVSNNIKIHDHPDSFWPAVADTVVEIEKLKKSGTPDAYVASQTATNAVIPVFSPAMFSQPALVTTSTGNLAKLKLLSRWEPRAKGPLQISKILLSLRATSLFPYNTVTYWEWDGQIQLNMHSASDFLGAEDFQMMEESVKKWVKWIQRNAQ